MKILLPVDGSDCALRAVGRTFVAVLLGIAIFLVALFVASLRT